MGDNGMDGKDTREKISAAAIVRDYGWTKGLIDRFLKDPELVPNPMYRSAPPMKLYKVADIKRVMKQKRFIAEFEKSKARKAHAAKAVETKEKSTMEHVDEMIGMIKVNVVDKVFERAVRSHNEFEDYKAANRWNYDPEYASMKNVPRNVLDRWAVNYVRHEETVYDEGLYNISGRVGVALAYVKYKSAVLDAIAKAYPFLKAECERQKPVIQEA